MSDKSDETLISTENSRRSFMKMGAIASGALALGGSTVGLGAAQEDDDGATDDGDTDGDTVLMLHPDAVENAEFTVQAEVDWSPIGDDAGDGATPDEETPGGDVGEDTPDDEETPTEEDDGGIAADGGESDFQTYMVQYGFSASHVAPVFVEGDVDLSEDDERSLGEIEEVVEQPGQDGGAGGINDDEEDGATGAVGEDEPLYVRVSLEDGAGAGGVDEETPTEETPTEEDDGGVLGGEDNETATEGDDGGILGGEDNETTTTTEGDDGGGIFG